MIFISILIVIFVASSIYFYFKAENLQLKLLGARRDCSHAQKSQKVLQEALALTAKKNEESVKYRLELLQKKLGEHENITLISPLINNYAVIFSECMKGKGKLKAVSKKCFDTYDAKLFTQFLAYLKSREKSLQRMWASDNLNGFISLIEALLYDIEANVKTQKAEKKKVVIQS